MSILDILWIIAGFVGTWMVFDTLSVAIVRNNTPLLYRLSAGLIGSLAVYTFYIQ